MAEKFNAAVDYINNLPKSVSISNEDKLNLYKYFKQGTVGNCKTSAPSLFQLQEKKKHEAWKSVENLDSTEAKRLYVETVSTLFPDWEK